MIDFNTLTAEEKDEQSLAMLCRRLLDIDPSCRSDKGCPYHLAAVPMIQAWANDRGWTNNRRDHPLIRGFLAADGQGRWCEFPEIFYSATTYLEENTKETQDERKGD